MPIDAPLRRYAYASGGLTQACSHCDWAQSGHQRELARCPACDAVLEQVAIEFGGILIVKRRGDFHFYAANGGFVSLEEADVPDALQFLCQHSTDFRRDDWESAPRARRIRNMDDFCRLCVEGWVGPEARRRYGW